MVPLALGGIKTRAMYRLALVYSLGMLVTAAATGALLGLIFTQIPEGWHQGIEIMLGSALLVMGIAFMLRPLSVHHAIDHICSEECQSGEEKALLRSGTSGAMFVLGAMSMLIPCPTNAWFYIAAPTLSRSPLTGALVFSVYALFTGVAVTVVAVAMVRARGLIEALERRGFRMLILRLSGIIVLAMGGWMLWLGTHPHEHGAGERPGIHQQHNEMDRHEDHAE